MPIVDHPVLKLFENETYTRPAKVAQCPCCRIFAGEVGKDEQEAEQKAVKLGFKFKSFDFSDLLCRTCFEEQSRSLPA